MALSVKVGRWQFRPRLWATVAAVLGMALTVALAQWQLGRAQEKAELQARHEAFLRQPPIAVGAREIALSDILLRRVEVHGRFQPRFTVYLDNRVRNGVPGYEVVTPVRISGSGMHVLVDRGWIAATTDRAHPPAVRTPEQALAIEGVAVAPSGRFLELSTRVAEGNVWQNLVIERFREATRLELHPFVVQQTGGPDDGLVREWRPPDLGRNTHLAYAFQWYALCVAILAYYLVTHVRRDA